MTASGALSDSGLTSENIKEIIRILDGASRVYLFGSRATKNWKKFSDVDLCVDSGKRIPDLKIAEWRDHFQQSNLPYKADLVDFHEISEDFRNLIREQWIEIHL